MQPAYQLIIDKHNITYHLQNRLIALQLTDRRGLYADQLELTISDHDNKIILPRRGVMIHCCLGWRHQTLTDKGYYIVDEIEHSGIPDKLIIRARSADFRNQLTQAKERSWHQKTLGDIVNTIANEQQLSATISPTLASTTITHLDQTHESDSHFLTRLAQCHDAFVTIKQGKLLMLPIGKGQTKSGKSLPTITLTREQTTQHHFKIADRQAYYSGVAAQWYNTQHGKQETITYGDPQRVHVIRQHFANQQDAANAAHAKWQCLQRSQYNLDITLALGHADISPESPIQCRGWKAPIDTLSWLVTEVQHLVNDSGFTSRVSLETRIEETKQSH